MFSYFLFVNCIIHHTSQRIAHFVNSIRKSLQKAYEIYEKYLCHTVTTLKTNNQAVIRLRFYNKVGTIVATNDEDINVEKRKWHESV